jgi:hypothetical protein
MSSKDFYSKIFLNASGENDSVKIEEFKSLCWFNLRDKNEGGLRLTDNGIDYLKNKADIKTYEIPIPKEVVFTPQVLIWLDKFIDTPWHLYKHTITVISERTAFELYLFSGDVRKMGSSKAMAARLSAQI